MTTPPDKSLIAKTPNAVFCIILKPNYTIFPSPDPTPASDHVN
jgi:hypothetical protein